MGLELSKLNATDFFNEHLFKKWVKKTPVIKRTGKKRGIDELHFMKLGADLRGKKRMSFFSELNFGTNKNATEEK